MKFATEHKVLHLEWDVVTVPAREFFMLYEGWFRENEDGDASLATYDYSPTFNFENGTMEGDEMWGTKDGRIWTSSGASGVMSWSEEKRSHISHVYHRETDLGQFLSAEFRLDDALTAALEKLSS